MSSESSSDPRAAELDALRRRVDLFIEARIGDLAVERGWITEAQLRQCQEQVDLGATDLPLGRLLVRRGLLTPHQAEELGGRADADVLGHAMSSGEPAVPAEVTKAAGNPDNAFGKFVIVREIGSGGMGVVSAAWQTDLGRWVALKRLRVEGPVGAARFLREGRLAAQVVHPNLVPIYEVGEHSGTPYLAMALLDGGSFEGRRLPIRQALETIMTIARAVQELHAAGIIHRDIKPANLFSHSSGRIYLGDFGLARGDETGPGLSRTGFMMGTPAYAPPEQVRGDSRLVGPRSDVYALGATLYALIAGEPPFQGGNPFETAQRSVDSDPPPLTSLRPEASHQVQTIVSKAMRKDPAQRYASSADFAEDVRRCLDGETLLAKPPTVGERLRAVVRRHGGLIAAGLLVVLVAGGGIGAWAWQKSRGRAEIETVRRSAARAELFWRAEAVSRDALRWADVMRRTVRQAEAAEVAVRLRELEAALAPLGTTPDGERLGAAMAARFTMVADDPDKGEALFEAMPPEWRSDPLVMLQRLRARLSLYIAAAPSPALHMHGALSPETRIDPGLSPVAAKWRKRVLDDYRAIRTAGLDPELEEAISLFLDGCEALAAGDGGRAAPRFAETTGRPEIGDDSRYFAGVAHLHLGEYEGAVAAWEGLLLRDPSRADARLALTGALVAQAARRATIDFASAEPLLDRAEREALRLIEDLPLSGEARSWLGTIAYVRTNYSPQSGQDADTIKQRIREGIDHFRRAAELGSSPVAADIGRAALLGLLPRYERLHGRDSRPVCREAIAILKGAVSAGGVVERSVAEFSLAGMLLFLGDGEEASGTPEAARACYEESLSIFNALAERPGVDEGPLRILRGTARLGLYRAGGKADLSIAEAAAADLRAGAQASRDSPRLQLMAAMNFLMLGYGGGRAGFLREAIDGATRAWEGGLRTADVLSIRGEARYTLGYHSEDPREAVTELRSAEEDFTAAIEKSPSDPRLRHKRGHVRKRLVWLRRDLPRDEEWTRTLKGAEEDYLRAASLAPRSAEYLFQAGVTMWMAGGREAEALDCWKRARDLKPTSADLTRRIEEMIQAIESAR